MSTPDYRFPSGKELTRMPKLASSLLRFNLPEELRRLRSEASWRRGTGRSSKTLAKYPDFHIVLGLSSQYPGATSAKTESVIRQTT